MRTAYSYIRFSSPEQAKGNSLNRQLDRSKSWAKEMGWQLDTSTFRDLGCSGFKPGKQLGLAAFLQAIEAGNVPKGSVLIVEALDRLSRRQLDDAYELFRKIIKTGVDIGVETRRRVYTKSSLNSAMELMEVVIAFDLANQESEKKSFRTKDNWARRRNKAKLGDVKASKRCPCWINVVDGKYKLDKAKAAVLERIFRMCVDGLGGRQITKTLNAEKITNIAIGSKTNCRKEWNQGYVESILHNRQTFGENQLFIMDGDKRIPDEVVEGFYPAAIPAKLFYAAQAAIKSRTKQKGPRGKQVANLFQGLIFDANTGMPMQMANSSVQDKKRGIFRRLASYHAHQMGNSTSWAYPEFEDYFIRAFQEITASQLASNPYIDPVPGIVSQIQDTQTQIEQVENKIVEGGEIPALVNVLRKLHAKQQSLEGELTAAKSDKSSREATQTENVLSCLELLKSGKEQHRDKFRALLRLIVDEIWLCIFSTDGNRLNRTLVCQIFFKTGPKREFILKSERGRVASFQTFKRGTSIAHEHMKQWKVGNDFDLRVKASKRRQA